MYMEYLQVFPPSLDSGHVIRVSKRHTCIARQKWLEHHKWIERQKEPRMPAPAAEPRGRGRGGV